MSQSSRTFLICLLLICGLCISVGSASTTEIRLVKYAADGVTILNERTVDYRWMESHLPVLGDGSTHYYHQGPIFEGDIWNPAEDTNLREMGAVKGTDLRDLCELVGGMSEGDTVTIRAIDGMRRTFPYANVYTPESRQGPMGITWYHHEDGYVPDYRTGMRLIFFADTSTNPDGKNVFGVADKQATFPEEYWYFYNGQYPTTTGLSVQFVSMIIINSNDEPTGSILIESDPIGASVYLDDTATGRITPCTLTDIETGMYTVRVEMDGYEIPNDEWVTVRHNLVEQVFFNLTPISGSVEVTSVPTNATIYLDEQDTGLRTNAILDFVKPGERTITLLKEGYENETVVVWVERDETTYIDVILHPTSSDPHNETSGRSPDADPPSTGKNVTDDKISVTPSPTERVEEPDKEPPDSEKGFFPWIQSLFRSLWGWLLSILGISPGESPEQLPEEDVTTPPVAVTNVTERDPGEQVARNRSGGLFIDSYPSGKEIILDNIRTVYQTPTVLYGVREGLHSIRFVSDDAYDPASGQRVWVHADAIMPITIDTIGHHRQRTLTITSTELQGERFTVNGLYPSYRIPDTVEVLGDFCWMTVHTDEGYYSISIPCRILNGETFEVSSQDVATAYLKVDSDPAGASIFVNGFPIQERTPAVIENLSPGKHRVVVSKPGYLPAEGEITIQPTTSGSAGTIRTSLTRYTSGSLSINSTPAGQRIHLYGRYTGETTPHVFEHMRIGTYDVKIQGPDETISRMVTVVPDGYTECMVHM